MNCCGLHLNFSEEFTDKGRSEKLREYHIRIGRFLKGNKYAQLLYDLFLRNAFAIPARHGARNSCVYVERHCRTSTGIIIWTFVPISS